MILVKALCLRLLSVGKKKIKKKSAGLLWSTPAAGLLFIYLFIFLFVYLFILMCHIISDFTVQSNTDSIERRCGEMQGEISSSLAVGNSATGRGRNHGVYILYSLTGGSIGLLPKLIITPLKGWRKRLAIRLGDCK